MTTNVGTIDRILRIVIGIALIAFALGFIAPGAPYAWIGWIGVIPLLTGARRLLPALQHGRPVDLPRQDAPEGQASPPVPAAHRGRRGSPNVASRRLRDQRRSFSPDRGSIFPRKFAGIPL